MNCRPLSVFLFAMTVAGSPAPSRAEPQAPASKVDQPETRPEATDEPSPVGGGRDCEALTPLLEEGAAVSSSSLASPPFSRGQVAALRRRVVSEQIPLPPWDGFIRHHERALASWKPEPLACDWSRAVAGLKTVADDSFTIAVSRPFWEPGYRSAFALRMTKAADAPVATALYEFCGLYMTPEGYWIEIGCSTIR